MSFQIVPFDDRTQKHPVDSHLPEWLPKHEFLMLIVAPAGSGKTTLLLNILLRIYHHYWHRVLVFSPTIHNDNKWDYLFKDPILMTQKYVIPCQIIENINSKSQSTHNELSDNSDIEDDTMKKYLKNRKKNHIVDPFFAPKTNNKSKTKQIKRIGLSKTAYQFAMNQHKQQNKRNVLSDDQAKSQFLSQLKRRQELSCCIVPPLLPEIQGFVKQYKTDILKQPSSDQFSFHQPFNSNQLQNQDDNSDSDTTGDNTNTIQQPNGYVNRKKDVFEEYSEETLVKEMELQDKKVVFWKKQKANLVDTMDRYCWVFDDMVGSGLFNQKRNNAFKRLCVRRRHFYSSVIGVTQAYKEIPKTTRTNANILILFRIDSDEELQTIYKEYPMGLKWPQWVHMVNTVTAKPYSFIMFNLQASDPRYRIVKGFDTPIGHLYNYNTMSMSSSMSM